MMVEATESIEVDEGGEENAVGGWTVLEDPQKIRLDGNLGHNFRMEGQDGARVGEQLAGGRGELLLLGVKVDVVSSGGGGGVDDGSRKLAVGLVEGRISRMAETLEVADDGTLGGTWLWREQLGVILLGDSSTGGSTGQEDGGGSGGSAPAQVQSVIPLGQSLE